jgi:hypothetical protein
VLDVSLLDGFVPQAGDVFEILTAGSISGTFANTILPALAGDLLWNLDYSTNSVTLAVAAPSLPGDFDFDGDVDGRDILIWQRGGSPSSLSAGDLADWEANFGVGPPQAANVAVPEPGALTLASLCLFGGLYFRFFTNFRG